MCWVVSPASYLRLMSAMSSGFRKRFERSFGPLSRDTGDRGDDAAICSRRSDHFLDRRARFEFLPITSTGSPLRGDGSSSPGPPPAPVVRPDYTIVSDRTGRAMVGHISYRRVCDDVSSSDAELSIGSHLRTSRPAGSVSPGQLTAQFLTGWHRSMTSLAFSDSTESPCGTSARKTAATRCPPPGSRRRPPGTIGDDVAAERDSVIFAARRLGAACMCTRVGRR